MRLTNYKTTSEAGAILGVTPRRVRQLIIEGRIKSIKLGRDYFMRLVDIIEFKLTDRDRRVK